MEGITPSPPISQMWTGLRVLFKSQTGALRALGEAQVLRQVFLPSGSPLGTAPST